MEQLYDLIFSLPSKSFTLVSVLFGFILIDDLDAAEQNALGNFLMLVGQILETNSSQQALINNIIQSKELQTLKDRIELLENKFKF